MKMPSRSEGPASRVSRPSHIATEIRYGTYEISRRKEHETSGIAGAHGQSEQKTRPPAPSGLVRRREVHPAHDLEP